jgi:hypothetical protein
MTWRQTADASCEIVIFHVVLRNLKGIVRWANSFYRCKLPWTVMWDVPVEIIVGDPFSDTVEYEAVLVREGLVVLTWQEHIGSTIVHVLDFTSCKAYTAVTPAKGGFKRLTGRIDVKLKV